jgi:hypothetical protein
MKSVNIYSANQTNWIHLIIERQMVLFSLITSQVAHISLTVRSRLTLDELNLS